MRLFFMRYLNAIFSFLVRNDRDDMYHDYRKTQFSHSLDINHALLPRYAAVRTPSARRAFLNVPAHPALFAQLPARSDGK